MASLLPANRLPFLGCAPLRANSSPFEGLRRIVFVAGQPFRAASLHTEMSKKTIGE
jgi:hypothetical protein